MKRASSIILALACACGAALVCPPGAAWAGPANPLDALRLEDLGVTRARPLFAPTRRPPPPPHVEAAPEPAPVEMKAVAVIAEPPPFDLVGSVIGRGTAFALLRNKTTNEVRRLRPGEDDEGWRVGEIGLRTVALERDGRHESLALAAPQPMATGAEVAGEPAPADPNGDPPPPPPPGVKAPFIGLRPVR